MCSLIKSLYLTQWLIVAIILLTGYSIIICIFIEIWDTADVLATITISNESVSNINELVSSIPLKPTTDSIISISEQTAPFNTARKTTMPLITNHSYPSTWQQLNEQQFCRIEQSDTQINLFQFLYKNQFPSTCSAPSTKFLIYDIFLETSSGLGASLFGNILRYFTTALMLNRTFMLHGVFDWSSIVDHCAHTQAMECYFLPLSNSTDNIYTGSGPTNCI
eukprot:1029448_1